MEPTDCLPTPGPAWTRKCGQICPWVQRSELDESSIVCTLDWGHVGSHEDHSTAETTGEILCWETGNPETLGTAR